MSDYAADLKRHEKLRAYDGPHDDAHAWEMEALESRFVARHHVEEIARLRAELEQARRERDALEKYSRNLLAVSRAVGVLGVTEVSEAEESLDRLLAAPSAPAPGGGGGAQ